MVSNRPLIWGGVAGSHASRLAPSRHFMCFSSKQEIANPKSRVIPRNPATLADAYLMHYGSKVDRSNSVGKGDASGVGLHYPNDNTCAVKIKVTCHSRTEIQSPPFLFPTFQPGARFQTMQSRQASCDVRSLPRDRAIPGLPAENPDALF